MQKFTSKKAFSMADYIEIVCGSHLPWQDWEVLRSGRKEFLGFGASFASTQAQEVHDTTRKSIADSYHNIAGAYIQINELSTAEKYLNKALELKTNSKTPFSLVSSIPYLQMYIAHVANMKKLKLTILKISPKD